jgi:hypothetical protein
VRLQPLARVFPAYLGESAKLREVFTMTPTKDQALQPVWGIIAHRQVIGQPFTLHSAGKETRPSLPPHALRRNCPRNPTQKCLLP